MTDNPERRKSDQRTWWQKYAGSFALVLVVVAGVAGFARVEQVANDAGDAADVATEASDKANGAARKANRVADKARQEGELRERQFCVLVLGEYEDRVSRQATTRAFLRSSAGREPTALNLYIREISLPQTEDEIKKERAGIPDICWQYQPKGAQQ